MQCRKRNVSFLLIGLFLGALIFQIGCGQAEKIISGVPGYTQDQVERGRYLALNVSSCVDCHTPRLPDGRPNEAMLFAGGEVFIPDLLWSTNITPDKDTGIGAWSDEQVVKAIQKGLGHLNDDPKGKPLSPMMPYYVYANMTTDDAMAIVAFIRTEVKPIKNEVSDPGMMIVPPEPSKPLNYASLPGAINDPGKYLTSAAGVCIECHTPRIPQTPPDFSKLDPTKYFAGGDEFPIPGIKVFTANVTSDEETGIGRWKEEELKAAIQKGLDDEGKPLCPPMPQYAGLTSVDINAIVKFLKSLPPIKNKVEECQILGR